MPLTITQASVGFDAPGVAQLKKDIHMHCIEDAKSNLDSNLSTLEESIDAIWIGKSADNFKANQRDDVESVKEALDKCYEVFDSELNAIVSEMGHVDQELVERR